MSPHADPQHDLSSPADVLLSDGRVAVVRQLEPTDGAALGALHAGIGPAALRLRFFSPSHHAAEKYVAHVMASPDTISIVAEVAGRMVALATAEPVDPTTSEVAFLCADDHHGLGLGTLLLEHLAAVGRDRGIERFVAEVLPDNNAMLAVFREAGFGLARRLEDGVVSVELSTVVTPELQEAVAARECVAERRSLAALFRPESVAVVGVRRDGTGIGAEIVRSVRSGGFAGRLAVVHPTAPEVLGLRTTRSCSDVPDGIDLAVLAVPAPACLAALEDAAAAGARVVVVVSSGFAETGDEGAALQRELTLAARRWGVRLVGPNCLGVMGNDPAVRLDATFGTGLPPRGGLAVASQSGGVGIALVEAARVHGLGLASFVSLGNKADVSGNDLLAAWYDDPVVTAAALYLESFGNARKFARTARRFSERKPLLAVVGGRSSGGRRAGASHTAAAASAAVGVDALFAQAGVIACSDVDDIVDTARLVGEQPLPGGARVAVVSNAGGLGVLAADLAAGLELELPEFSAALQQRLLEVAPGTAGTTNPVDAGAGAGTACLAATLRAVLEADEVDAVVVVVVATALADGRDTLGALEEVRRTRPGVPVVLVAADTGDPTAGRTVTTYASARAAVAALAHLVGYAAWRRAPRPASAAAPATDGRQLRTRALDLLAARRSSDAWFSGGEAAPLLEAAGIALSGVQAGSEDAAVAAADHLGYPVVVKCDHAAVTHRTDRGLVHLGLAGPDQVRAAVAAIGAELGETGHLLVQPQVQGVELALGIVRDPGLGPLLMVAAGGIATEVWADRVFLVPPVHPEDAVRAVRALRTWPLLAGFRGAPRADVVSFERLVLAVGRLAQHVPELAELDLNPVIVTPDGSVVVDVAIRLAVPGDGLQPDAPGVRSLRAVR